MSESKASPQVRQIVLSITAGLKQFLPHNCVLLSRQADVKGTIFSLLLSLFRYLYIIESEIIDRQRHLRKKIGAEFLQRKLNYYQKKKILLVSKCFLFPAEASRTFDSRALIMFKN